MSDSRSLEIEIKLCLASFADYLKLLGFLGAADKEIEQVNVFFDTPSGRLRAAGWALRVRTEQQSGLVTAKGVTTHRGAAAVREEIEEPVDRGLAVEIQNGMAKLTDLKILPIARITDLLKKEPLQPLVRFSNERKLKRFPIGDRDYTLALDRTEFGCGHCDYELEVEVVDESEIERVQQWLQRTFKSLNVPFEAQTQSKLERALEHAERLG